MDRVKWFRVSTLAVFVAVLLLGQLAMARDGAPPIGKATPAPTSTGYVTPYFYPSYGGYGGFGFYRGYFSPFMELPMIAPATPYLPKYWWAEPYPTVDPRQAGYNPNSGYPKEDVTTLLLETYPKKARVVLDGLFVGTSDSLGPFQLPMGEHTLRVEAAGFEPSVTVLQVEQPALQQLDIRLKPVTERATAPTMNQ
jgi:hypothetical protein